MTTQTTTAAITDITVSIFADDLPVSAAEAEAYAQAVEQALTAHYPAALVIVDLEVDVVGAKRATTAYCGETEADAGEIDRLVNEVWESGIWQ